MHWIHKVSVFTLTAPSSFCSRSGDASPGYARKGWTGFYRSTGTSTSIKWSDGSSAFSVWSTRWLTSSTTVSDCSLASVDLAFLLVRSPYFVLPTCHGNRPEFDPFLVMLVPHTQKGLATFWPNGAIRSPFKGNRISLGAKVDQRGYCYADKQRNSSPNAKFFQQLVWRAKRKTFRFLFVDVSIKEGNWLLLLLLHARFFCSTNTPLLPPFTTFTISLSWRLL